MNPEKSHNSQPNTQEVPIEDRIIQEREAAAGRLMGRSFKTERGSIYSYGEMGSTTRFKAASGETHAAQDITVFVDLDDAESQVFLHAMHDGNSEARKKVYVVERQGDMLNIVRTFSNVSDPNNLYLAIVESGKVIRTKKAVLKPTIGYSVFDSRHFQDGKEWKTERHLGHKVTEIN